MDNQRSPVISDGPEYSRLSDSYAENWYAEGHRDPQEEKEERQLARSLREEERREQRRENNGESSSLLGTPHSDAIPIGATARRYYRNRRSQDLSPKSSNSKQTNGTSQPRSDSARETVDPNGNTADDESTPPSNSPTNNSGGAQHIPAASIQAPTENPEEPTSSSPPRLLPQPSHPQHSCCESVKEFWKGVARCATKLILVTFVASTIVFGFAFWFFFYRWVYANMNELVNQMSELRPSTFSPTGPQKNINVRLEVFFYNVTYIEDEEGTPRPHIEDKGPYSYSVNSSKTAATWNPNGTVSYQIQERFHFLPGSSVGDETDVINTMDADILAKLSTMEIKNTTTKYHFNLTDGMMRPQTVRDFLIGGDDKNEEAPLKQNTSDILKLLKTKETKFRDSDKSNVSTSPLYNVYTGKGDIDRLNKMYTFNGSRANHMWATGHDHFPISGSADGDFFPPSIRKDQTLAFFYSQTERNLLLRHQKSLTIKGHEAYRFAMPEIPIDLEDVRQSNTPIQDANDTLGLTDDFNDDDVIPLDDVISLVGEVGRARVRKPFALQYLKRDSPFVVSFQPNSSEGLYGNRSKLCDIYLDIHPASGITMRKRLCHQMSLPVVYPGPKSHGFILPIMWVDWFYEYIPDDLDVIEHAQYMLRVIKLVTLISLITWTAAVVLFSLQCITLGSRHCKCCHMGEARTPDYLMMCQQEESAGMAT